MTMRSKARRGADIRKDESGAVLILVGLTIVILIGMAAFAVDFGWIYWNGIKIQHGADAAALAGVVYEPADQTTAYTAARGSASENGYVDSSPETTVTPVDFGDDPNAVENENQLAVTVTHEVGTFFLSVFGIDTVSLTRRAVAEYALPLAMGSDLPYFGQDPALNRNPNFWANIHGYYTRPSATAEVASPVVRPTPRRDPPSRRVSTTVSPTSAVVISTVSR